MKQFDDVISRAADRIRADLARIDERFPSEMPVMTAEEVQKHMADYGHAYDDACTAPHCQKWREMVAGATRAVAGGV